MLVCVSVCSRPRAGVLNAMDLTRLPRKHGIKIAPSFPCSVEECSLAVGRVGGHSSVKSTARMNNTVVIFLDSVEKVNTVVTTGIEVSDAFVSVLPLATPAVKVTVAVDLATGLSPQQPETDRFLLSIFIICYNHKPNISRLAFQRSQCVSESLPEAAPRLPFKHEDQSANSSHLC